MEKWGEGYAERKNLNCGYMKLDVWNYAINLPAASRFVSTSTTLSYVMDALATANARNLIEKYSIKDPQQYTVEQILNAEGLILEEKPLDGCAGSIVFSEKIGIVTVDTKIKEGAQKRFVTAHELGHFENEKAKIKFCSYEDIMSIKRILKMR